MNTRLLVKSIINVVITSFPLGFSFCEMIRHTQRRSRSVRRGGLVCGHQSFTPNGALLMYINRPLWLHTTLNTSVEGISVFDILEQEHSLIPLWRFPTLLMLWYAFINLGLLRRLHLQLTAVIE